MSKPRNGLGRSTASCCTHANKIAHQSIYRWLVYTAFAILLLTRPSLLAYGLDFYMSAGSGIQTLHMQRDTQSTSLPFGDPTNSTSGRYTARMQQGATDFNAGIGMRFNFNRYLQLKTEVSGDYNHGSITESYGFQDKVDNDYMLKTQQPWHINWEVLPTLNWQRINTSVFMITGLSIDQSRTQSFYDGGGKYGPSGQQTRWVPGYILGAGLEKDFNLKNQRLGIRGSWSYVHNINYQLQTENDTYSNAPPPFDGVLTNSYRNTSTINLSSQSFLASLVWYIG